MPAELKAIAGLLRTVSLNRAEAQLCERIGCILYQDDLPIILELIKKEIDASGIEIPDIAGFIEKKEPKIVEFGALLLKDKPTRMLSTGVTITYAIYLILMQADASVLEDYLARRKIPDPRKVAKELRDIRAKMKG